MNTDTIKKENKKALPKLLITVLISMVLGGIIGFFSGAANESGLSDAVVSIVNKGLYTICPWGIPAVGFILLLPAYVIYRKAKKLYSGWDGEDEILPDQVDNLLNWCILLTTIFMLINFFFMSVCMVCRSESILLVTVELIAATALIVVLQQRIVDLTRKMNPEKRGSIYDRNFQKKWIESCDEAERRQIGEAAYKAYLTTNAACISLWVVLFFVHIIFNTGLLSTFVVLLLWGIMQASYVLSCIKQSHKKSDKELHID